MLTHENLAPSIVVGLISDTHMPARWKKLPAAIFESFAGVDLILHAGDVGKLWVLDELSRIAPVIAVHGNDETVEATQALPYLQTTVIAGQRIVLTHSHFPDRTEEMEHRKNDDWRPKPSRLTDFGRQHGADIVVYGHSHIPMAVQHEGILLVNPGAIASGSWTTRQFVQSIARLRLQRDTRPSVEHICLDEPGHIFIPQIDLAAGFMVAQSQFSETILEPELETQWAWLRDDVYHLAPEAFLEVFSPLAHRCWSRETTRISVLELAGGIKASDIPAAIKDKLRESPVFSRYL